MAKRGNIFYTDKDFTDLEIQQEFGFPCILILHDNTSVIKKITAFDKIGTKTIYDFSLAATKDFVIQSIADAVAGLNDNVLELNSYSDFPQPGEVGNIYIALDVDQIFVWNTESQSYVQQSWDAYVIQQLQTNIASAQMAFQNLQNSKLDKPLSPDNISTRVVNADNSTSDKGEFQLSEQIEIGTSQPVQASWRGKEVWVTASCTLTIPDPATLPPFWSIDVYVYAGTLTFAITSPGSWIGTAPANAPADSFCRIVRRGNTNTFKILGL